MCRTLLVGVWRSEIWVYIMTLFISLRHTSTGKVRYFYVYLTRLLLVYSLYIAKKIAKKNSDFQIITKFAGDR